MGDKTVILEDGDTCCVELGQTEWVSLIHVSDAGRVSIGEVTLDVCSERVHVLTDGAMCQMRRKLTIPQMMNISIGTFLKWKLQLLLRGHIPAEDVHNWRD